MNYLNPFSLPGCNPDKLSDATSASVRRVKKRVLAEFELSDDEVLEVEGREVKKSAARRALNDLKDPQKRHYHAIIYKNRSLLQFLYFGELDYFRDPPNDPLLDDPGLVRFVSSYFASRYGEVLKETFRDGSREELQDLVEGKFLVTSEDREKCYGPAYTFLQTTGIDPLESICRRVREKKQTPPRIGNIIQVTSRVVSSGKLNVLPPYFADLRDRFGECIRSLAIALNNDCQETGLAYRLLDQCRKIKLGGRVQADVERDLETLTQQAVYREHKQVVDKYSRLCAEITELLNWTDAQLKSKLLQSGKLPGRLPAGRELVPRSDKLLDQIDKDELNRLPLEFIKLRSNVAMLLTTLSAALLYCAGDRAGLSISHDLHHLALQLKTDEETTQILKDRDLQYQKARRRVDSLLDFGNSSELGWLGKLIASAMLIVLFLVIRGSCASSGTKPGESELGGRGPVNVGASEPRMAEGDKDSSEMDLTDLIMSQEKAALLKTEQELTSMAQSIESRRKELETLKTEIGDLESNLRAGKRIGREEYESAIDRYNKLAGEYNELLARYREKYEQYKENVAELNDKIQRYNQGMGP